MEEQRDALHIEHTRQYDQEMAKLIDANEMNLKPIMQRQRTISRPVKPLRNLPDRYRYVLQNCTGLDPAIYPVQNSHEHQMCSVVNTRIKSVGKQSFCF